MDRKSERGETQTERNPGERDLHRVQHRENQRDPDRQRETERPRKTEILKEDPGQETDAENHGNRERQSAQCLHTTKDETETQRQRQRERETQRGREMETERKQDPRTEIKK